MRVVLIYSLISFIFLLCFISLWIIELRYLPYTVTTKLQVTWNYTAHLWASYYRDPLAMWVQQKWDFENSCPFGESFLSRLTYCLRVKWRCEYVWTSWKTTVSWNIFIQVFIINFISNNSLYTIKRLNKLIIHEKRPGHFLLSDVQHGSRQVLGIRIIIRSGTVFPIL